MVAREMPRPCATLCRGRPWWHKVPRHKLTWHKVTRHKVLAQGCRHKALAPGHEHISWTRTDYENDYSSMQIIIISCVRGTSKTMKMITVLCISYDSEANRQLPTHFQNHENADRPMHF